MVQEYLKSVKQDGDIRLLLLNGEIIDIIAGKLVEINCVSPGGIPWINRLNNDRMEKKVIDFIEQRVSAVKGGRGKGRSEPISIRNG